MHPQAVVIADCGYPVIVLLLALKKADEPHADLVVVVSGQEVDELLILRWIRPCLPQYSDKLPYKNLQHCWSASCALDVVGDQGGSGARNDKARQVCPLKCTTPYDWPVAPLQRRCCKVLSLSTKSLM